MERLLVAGLLCASVALFSCMPHVLAMPGDDKPDCKFWGYTMSERSGQNVKENRVCCNKMSLIVKAFSNEKKCLEHSNFDKAGKKIVLMDECFGGMGDGCNGIPRFLSWALGKVFRKRFPLCRKVDDETYNCVTTVGSIRHDLCCLKYPDGMFCNSNNYPVVNLLAGKKAAPECACASEMRKAVLNLKDARYWMQTFKKAPSTMAELKMLGKGDTRPTILQAKIGKFEPKVMLRGIYENKATLRLKAPAHTALDCPPTDSRCQFTCSENDFKSGICVYKGKRKRSPKRVKGSYTRFYPNGITAGDSVFCESKKFGSISYKKGRRGRIRKIWGLCSEPDIGVAARSVASHVGQLLSPTGKPAGTAARRASRGIARSVASAASSVAKACASLKKKAESGRPDERVLCKRRYSIECT